MKKVLSFVLITALVLSSFSMAFAGSSTEIKTLSDIDGNTNAEAIEVNYDLGIVTGNPDGTFQPAKAVTRAEFAAMITRALAIPQSALAGYANANFKDTNGYAWAVPYLAFCNSKGIMLGDGAGNAMPGKTITVNEAVTMALRAVGYTANSSELTGVWPSNYVTKAQELKMYDDVAKDAAGVDKANAAQIIYNTLTVQKVAVNSDGKTEKLWSDSKKDSNGNYVNATTLLSAGLNCEAHKDVVVGVDYKIDDSLINMAKHLGQYGTVYTNDDKEIVAFISDCDTLTGRFTNDNGTIEFKTTGDEKEYNVADKVTIGGVTVDNFKNVKYADLTVKEIYDTKLTATEKGYEYTVNVDLSGKTIKEIYNASAWQINENKQVTASDIADIKDDHSLLGKDFNEEDNDQIDYTQFQLVGVKSLSDIKVDDVVYVYANDKDIVRIEVGTQTIEGTVSDFETTKDDVATKFAIGANKYKNAEEVLNFANGTDGASIDEDTVSNDVKAFLDARGFVFDFTDSDKASNYAVIERVGGSIDSQVKVMLADGTEKVLTFKDKEEDCGALTTDSVIGYGLNSAGEIKDSNKNFIGTTSIELGSAKSIKTITGAKYMSTSGVYEVAGGAVTSGPATLLADQKYTQVTFSAITNAKIADNCVVFTYDKDKKEYDTTTIDKVEVNKVINGAVLLFDENNNGTAKTDKVVAMIVDSKMAKGGTKSYAVLNKKNKSVNADKDSVWKVVGYLDGKDLVDALTDDDTTLKNAYAHPDYRNNDAVGTFGTIALYEVKVDAKGVITDATEVAGASYQLSSTAINVKYGSTSVGTVTDVEDVHYIPWFTVATADKNDSITVDTKGAKASVYGTNGPEGRFTIASDANIYRLDSNDEYKKYTGDFKAGDLVQLYETNDDKDGYDVVIVVRN